MKLRTSFGLAASTAASLGLLHCVSDTGGGPTVDASVDATTVGNDAGSIDPPDTSTLVDASGGEDAGPLDAGEVGDGALPQPTPVGTFISKFTFASTNQSPPGTMRVAYDSQGNLFVAFPFTGTTTVGSVTLTAAGTLGRSDLGVAKLSPQGTVLWAKNFGGDGGDSPNAIKVDESGDVYIIGGSEGASIAFDSITLARRSQRYMFWLVKLNGSTGVPTIAQNFDSSDNSSSGGGCAGLDLRKKLIAIGCNFMGTAALTNSQGQPLNVLPPPGTTTQNGIVVALLDKDTFRATWATGLGSSEQEFLHGVALRDDGSVAFAAVTGSNGGVGGVTFSGGGVNQVTPVSTTGSAIVGRLSAANGLANWVSISGGSTGRLATFGLTFDNDDVIAVGAVRGTVAVDTKTLTGPATGTDTIALLRYDVNGTPAVAQIFGGADIGNTAAQAVTLDPWRNVLITGQYTRTAMAYDGGLPTPFNNSQSGFLVKLGPSFNHIWSKGFTTASDTTFVQSWAVASSKTGNIAQSGSFQGIVNLGDNNPVMSNLNGGGYDVFIVQRAP